MGIVNVTFDNVGDPDDYTVQGVCRKLVLREKDRDAASLTRYRVYTPKGATASGVFSAGEVFEYSQGIEFRPGDKPFAVETIDAESAEFQVTESW